MKVGLCIGRKCYLRKVLHLVLEIGFVFYLELRQMEEEELYGK